MYGLNKLNSHHMIKETGRTQLEIWQIGLYTSSTCKLTISDTILDWIKDAAIAGCMPEACSLKHSPNLCRSCRELWQALALLSAVQHLWSSVLAHIGRPQKPVEVVLTMKRPDLLYLWGLQFNYSFLFWRTMNFNRDFDPLKTSSYKQLCQTNAKTKEYMYKGVEISQILKTIIA